MGNKFNNFLKGIFVTSLSTLTSIETNADSKSTFNPLDFGNNEAKLSQENSSNILTNKLLLKMNSDHSYLLVGHRSHRSHSSHRSHYSSSSGNTTRSTNSSGNSSSTSSNSSSGNTLNITPTVKIFKLGDRVLKKGMKGPDVTELRNILVDKEYLKLKEYEDKVAVGELEFTDTIEIAVKIFQLNKKLPGDGIVGNTTIYYLKKQNDLNK